MLSLNGHIGAKASALVDGQLPPAEEERAWSHVLACPGCRRAVEHEGWVKRQLGTLSTPGDSEPDDRLLGSLYDVDPRAAWAEVEVIERRSVRRRTTVALVGGSAVGACALALVTMTSGPIGRGPTTPAPADVTGGVWMPTDTVSPFGTETDRFPVRPGRSR